MGTALAVSFPAAGQDASKFPPEQIATGAAVYARNCSPCHGATAFLVASQALVRAKYSNGLVRAGLGMS